ncbi:hypothetical protein ACH4U6_35970 [Streptomyces netropsis]|uniref:hypothetical protein n=1 Tax=Streptomyces netropsis TaxID=55404 RepID=UPI00378788F1
MFPGRAGHLGGDADLGEESLLFVVELVIRAALAPQPSPGEGIVEVAEAGFGVSTTRESNDADSCELLIDDLRAFRHAAPPQGAAVRHHTEPWSVVVPSLAATSEM